MYKLLRDYCYEKQIVKGTIPPEVASDGDEHVGHSLEILGSILVEKRKVNGVQTVLLERSCWSPSGRPVSPARNSEYGYCCKLWGPTQHTGVAWLPLLLGHVPIGIPSPGVESLLSDDKPQNVYYPYLHCQTIFTSIPFTPFCNFCSPESPYSLFFGPSFFTSANPFFVLSLFSL